MAYTISPAMTASGRLLPASAAWTRTLSVVGSSGADFITSPGGGRHLKGGYGDDTYDVWDTRDTVTERSGAGIDTVVSHMPRYLLPAQVENLYVAAKGAAGTGNGLANLIVGGSGSQTLDGGAGNDVLTGGAGADTFVVAKGNGSDVITDFTNKLDVVSLVGATGLADFTAVGARLAQAGKDVVLDLGGGESLTFRGHAVADFSAADFGLRVASPPPVANPPPATNLLLTFADEFGSFQAAPGGFDGAGAAVWSTTYPWGDRTIAGNHEAEYYSDATVGANPFSVSNGMLQITAAPAAGGSAAAAAGLGYTSGLITTATSFSQTYGYFEIRAELPAGQGFWPAFWLLPTDMSWPPEIDVIETIGSDPGNANQTIHSAAGGSHVATGFNTPISDPAAAHTYGVSWRPDMIRFFVDSVETAHVATPADMHKPMYLLANLAVGGAGSWPGPAAPGSTATMKIDYIHAYEYADLATPQAIAAAWHL